MAEPPRVVSDGTGAFHMHGVAAIAYTGLWWLFDGVATAGAAAGAGAGAGAGSDGAPPSGRAAPATSEELNKHALANPDDVHAAEAAAFAAGWTKAVDSSTLIPYEAIAAPCVTMCRPSHTCAGGMVTAGTTFTQCRASHRGRCPRCRPMGKWSVMARAMPMHPRLRHPRA